MHAIHINLLCLVSFRLRIVFEFFEIHNEPGTYGLKKATMYTNAAEMLACAKLNTHTQTACKHTIGGCHS